MAAAVQFPVGNGARCCDLPHLWREDRTHRLEAAVSSPLLDRLMARDNDDHATIALRPADEPLRKVQSSPAPANGSANMVDRPGLSSAPALSHRFRCSRSILALVVAGHRVFAGTQGGDIAIFDLRTFERIRTIVAHRGSILGFCLSRDKKLLFSTASDRITNVWDTRSLQHVASIYSLYDVGDVFCVSFSNKTKTVYLGSQNTSIQWCCIADLGTRRPANIRSHPSYREDRFFDSSGPGGVRTPRPQPDNDRTLDTTDEHLVEIDKNQIKQFAHYGYVYYTLLASGSSLGLTSDDEYLLSGGGDGAVNIWSLDTANNGAIHSPVKLQDRSEDGNSVLSMAIEGTFLYAGRCNGQVSVWDLETKQLIRRLQAHHDEILSLSVGRGLVLAGSLDGNVIKFNRRHDKINEWEAHSGRILSSAFAEVDDKFFYITGSNDDTVALWNIKDCDRSELSSSIMASQEELYDTLKTFISFRTVSSDPHHREDCRRGASFIRGVLKKLGAGTSMLTVGADYNPVVFGRFRGKKNANTKGKTVLFYGHYDVVAATDRQKKWLQDPFAMTGVDGYLYGRGVSDNKGPIIAAIYAASDLIAANKLDGDIVFLLEGEEECGSKGFQETIRAHKDFIGPVDWICLANSYWLDDETPCLTYGLRGLIHATVDVHSTEPDLHSGVDGSRLLDEPLKDLVAVVSRLTGPQNKIAIPGFYDDTLPLSKDEKQLYDEIAHVLLDRSPELGTHDSITASLMGRWRDASLTVHHFRTSSSEKSTIIPSHATASLSMRLVPNQDVEQIGVALKTHLESSFAQLGSKNRLTVTINHKAEPWLGDFRNKMFKCLERAVSQVWSAQQLEARPPLQSLSSLPGEGSKPPATSSTLASATSPVRTSNADQSLPAMSRLPSPLTGGTPAPSQVRKPLYIREGGSIPAIRFLEKEFDAPAAHFPCGQASDNAHLDNERLRVINLLNAREIFRRVFGELPGL